MSSERNRNFYLLSESGFYRLGSKKALCELLDSSMPVLRSLLSREDNYHVFVVGDAKNRRQVQSPKFMLRNIHERVFKLLQRIQAPSYLFSGIKGRSYIHNAKVHACGHMMLKIDVRQFYPSTERWMVKKCFARVFECAPDVAGLIADICTTAGEHGKRCLPTGSPLSQIVAYFSHKELFDRLASFAEQAQLIFSLYVDDLAFSGIKVTRDHRESVVREIGKVGLRVHSRKMRLFNATEVKKLTGVMVTQEGHCVPNSLRHDIILEFEFLRSGRSASDFDRRFSSLFGRLGSAQQIEPSFGHGIKQELQNIKRKRRVLSEAGARSE